MIYIRPSVFGLTLLWAGVIIGCSEHRTPEPRVPDEPITSIRQTETDASERASDKSPSEASQATETSPMEEASVADMPMSELAEDTKELPSAPKHDPIVLPVLTVEERQAIDALEAYGLFADSPEYIRQRPCALFCIREEYGGSDDLTSPCETSLNQAEHLTKLGFDVTIAVGVLSSQKWKQSRTLARACQRIAEINASLSETNEKNSASDQQQGIAPLKLIAMPQTFDSSVPLQDIIESWFIKNFRFSHLSANTSSDLYGRAPFGTIIFNGHGVAAWTRDRQHITQLYFKAASNVNADTNTERIPSDIYLGMHQIAKLPAKFQAPIWVVADTCRELKNKGTLPPIDARLAPPGPVSRNFSNLDQLSAEQRMVVQEIQKLNLLRHLDSTLLACETLSVQYPTKRHLEFTKDASDASLCQKTAEALEVQVDDMTGEPYFAITGDAKATALTLTELNEFTRKAFALSMRSSEPFITAGSMHPHMTVASAKRGKFTYQPKFYNLLQSGVASDALYKDFLQSRFDGSVRLENDGEGNPVWLVDLEQPVILQQNIRQKVVLQLSATSSDADDRIKFSVGAIWKESQSDRHVLTSDFTNYGENKAFSTGLPCDGIPRYFETSLDSIPADATSVPLNTIEIQAGANNITNNWKKDVEMKVHGVYLLPADMPLTPLREQIYALPIGVNLLGKVWPGAAIPSDDPTITYQDVDVSNESEQIRFSSNLASGKPWGVSSSIYPQSYLEQDSNQVFIQADCPPDLAEKSIGIGLFSGEKVLAAKGCRLGELSQGILLDLMDSGLVQELVFQTKNPLHDIVIKKLEFRKAKKTIAFIGDNNTKPLILELQDDKKFTKGTIEDHSVSGIQLTSDSDTSQVDFDKLLATRPDVAIVMIGSNDGLADPTTLKELAEKKLTFIVQQLRSGNPDVKVLLCMPPHFSKDQRDQRDEIKKALKSMKNTMDCDIMESTILSDIELSERQLERLADSLRTRASNAIDETGK